MIDLHFLSHLDAILLKNRDRYLTRQQIARLLKRNINIILTFIYFSLQESIEFVNYTINLWRKRKLKKEEEIVVCW